MVRNDRPNINRPDKKQKNFPTLQKIKEVQAITQIQRSYTTFIFPQPSPPTTQFVENQTEKFAKLNSLCKFVKIVKILNSRQWKQILENT